MVQVVSQRRFSVTGLPLVPLAHAHLGVRGTLASLGHPATHAVHLPTHRTMPVLSQRHSLHHAEMSELRRAQATRQSFTRGGEMKYYIFQPPCVSCKTPLQPRQICFGADGGIMFVGWCTTCHVERQWTTDSETLRQWAYSQNPAQFTPKDGEFLKEQHIKWEDDGIK